MSQLGLTPLPVEGGLWAQSWRDASCSAIYYLLATPSFSGLHRLDRVEIFVHHAGAPVRMTLLDNGSVTEHVLGSDVTEGQRPQVVVPAGTWQASETLGAWSLMGTVVVPPYADDCVEFASAREVAAEYPEYADRLRPLCRLP